MRSSLPDTLAGLPARQVQSAGAIWRLWDLGRGQYHVWHRLVLFLSMDRAPIVVAEGGKIIELCGWTAWTGEFPDDPNPRGDVRLFRDWRRAAVARMRAWTDKGAFDDPIDPFAGLLTRRQRETAIELVEKWPIGGPIGMFEGVMVFMAEERTPHLVAADGAICNLAHSDGTREHKQTQHEDVITNKKIYKLIADSFGDELYTDTSIPAFQTVRWRERPAGEVSGPTPKR